MSLLEILLISISLAMDCFAVSICYGFASNQLKARLVLRMALFFGFFQGIMPVIGWLTALSFIELISSADHWVAFGLLLIIGTKMITEAVRGKGMSEYANFDRFIVILGLSIATSIDALIIGLSFALLEVNILKAVIVIGVVSFIFTLAGIYLGKRIGSKFGKTSEIIGGAILISIGAKILIEHLFF